MITTDLQDNLVSVVVFGEFTVADFREFEDTVASKGPFKGPLNVFFDLRQMAGFTVDVAWEEIKFLRQHPGDFDRVAVLTESEWVTWNTWLSQAFTDADVGVFTSEGDAQVWLEGGA